MKRYKEGYGYINPRQTNNFLDTCAFDPKYAPEDQVAQAILDLHDKGIVQLLLSHTNQKEIEHPNTPTHVKKRASEMIFTIEAPLNIDEVTQQARIHAVLTGTGNPVKYRADATHVFEAGKYGGYFITTDNRILLKRDELADFCEATILKPSEWLNIFNN